MRKLYLCLLLSAINIIYFYTSSYGTDVLYNKVSNLASPVKYFVGRHDILEEVNKYHAFGENIVSLVGISGIGKSQIIRKYIENHENEYEIIWILNCANDLDLEFRKLAHEINQKICRNNSCFINETLNTVTDEVINFLNIRSNWILVYDNISIGQNKILNNKLNTNFNKDKKQHILIGSQEKINLPNVINIKRFSRKDSFSLLTLLINEHHERNLDLNIISEHLTDYPLTLVKVLSQTFC